MYCSKVTIKYRVLICPCCYAQGRPRHTEPRRRPTEGDFLFGHTSDWVRLTVPLHRNSNNVRFHNYLIYIHTYNIQLQSYIRIHVQSQSKFRVVSALGRSAGSFRRGSFRPILGVGRFGLGRWVVSALGRFGPESFRPNFNMVGYISMG